MTKYLTAAICRAIFNVTDVNSLFTTPAIGKLSGHKSWVVLEVFEGLNRLNVVHKDGWNARTKSHYWRRSRDFFAGHSDTIKLGITLGFDDYDRLKGFCEMPELVLQQQLAELIFNNEIVPYRENSRDYDNFAIVPPLLAIFPQKVPTNLIKRTVHKEGKPVHTEHFNRNLSLDLAVTA